MIRLLLACAPTFFSEVEVEVAEDMPTMVTLRWTTAARADSWVEVGPSTPYVRVEATSDGRQHEATIWGLRGGETHHFRLGAAGEEGPTFTEDQVFETGPMPHDLPRMTVDRVDADVLAGTAFLAPVSGQHLGVVLMDRDGELLWWAMPEPWDVTYSPAAVHAFLAPDGDGVIFNLFDAHIRDPPETSAFVLYRVGWDGQLREELSLPGGHHDFYPLADGSIAYLAYDVRDGHVGDKIVERAADGTEREVWSAWDQWDWYPAGEAEMEAEFGWSHANALDYLPEEDAYVVGFRHLNALVKVDRASGETLWVLGGDYSDFTLAGGSWFTNQHQVDLTEHGLLVFDNGSTDDGVSRAVEYRVDEETREVEQIWTYVASPPFYNALLGDVQRLGDDSLVVWSARGRADLVDEEGEVLWRVNTDLGTAFGYLTVVEGF